MGSGAQKTCNISETAPERTKVTYYDRQSRKWHISICAKINDLA